MIKFDYWKLKFGICLVFVYLGVWLFYRLQLQQEL